MLINFNSVISVEIWKKKDCGPSAPVTIFKLMEDKFLKNKSIPIPTHVADNDSYTDSCILGHNHLSKTTREMKLEKMETTWTEFL